MTLNEIKSYVKREGIRDWLVHRLIEIAENQSNEIYEYKDKYEKQVKFNRRLTLVVNERANDYGILDLNYKELKEGLELSLKRNALFGCIQNCDGNGAIQLSEDEWEECQWCSERKYLESLLNR